MSASTLTVAMAAGNETAYEIIYSFYPQLAKMMVPVNESCEDNGIRMSVEAIDVHGDTAEIYISLKDLEGDVSNYCAAYGRKED